MSADKRRASNDEPPLEKRVKFSLDDLAEELQILENEEIKTGIVKPTKPPVIILDNQEIDLQNIDSNLVSKLQFDNNSPPEIVKMEIDSEMCKPLEKRLENVNSHSLSFLGQSIAIENFGNNYQTIAYKFVVYRESDFPPSRQQDDDQEENLAKLLILVCPTDCEGGDINFPQLKRNFSADSDQVFSYVLFDNKTQYNFTKITRGSRVFIVYKIFVNQLECVVQNLTFISVERLKSMLNSLRTPNILISMYNLNIVKHICQKFSLNFIEVYSDNERPIIVYNRLENDEYDSFQVGWHNADIDFHNLVANVTGFTVRTFVNVSRAKKIFKPVIRYFDSTSGPREAHYDVDYYAYVLINPCEHFPIENGRFQDNQPEGER